MMLETKIREDIRMTALRLAAGALLLAVAVPAAAQPHTQPPIISLPVAARGPAATVDAFHAALRRGDTAAAARLLSDDALIFESGGVERSKAEYADHHLGADAEFSRAVPSVVTRRSGGSDGRTAWIASEGRTTGTFRGRSIDSRTTETMVLRRVGPAWRISHIHWSSASAAPARAATDAQILATTGPANAATLSRAPSTLELHFATPARLLEVMVAGPNGQMPMMVTAPRATEHYSLPLPPLGPGSYSVDWRANVAGREQRGSFSFRVR
jgi:ketosteroid isomerase-like protein